MRSTFLKQFHRSMLLSVAAMLLLAVNPVVAANSRSASAQSTVTASAVVVPAQVSEMGFLISGIARDIPVRKGDTVKAGQTLIVLDTPELHFTITEAEARLRGAEAQVQIRRNDIIKQFKINYETFTVKKLFFSVPHEEIEMAEGEVQRAQALIEIAQARLAQGTLTAPFDGTITSLDVIPGEFVQSSRAVITVATLDALQIETTDLREHAIPSVRVGDTATIVVEALNESFSGTVVSISPRADKVGGDVVFKVTIAPDTQPAGLLWGMTAEVEIHSGE